ncbi:hypothetical protein B0E53_06661 [Micromonospora sp. MH33]|nr:hypothetical protein B0E53_06661 [Micromonospora sp. MH33]
MRESSIRGLAHTHRPGGRMGWCAQAPSGAQKGGKVLGDHPVRGARASSSRRDHLQRPAAHHHSGTGHLTSGTARGLATRLGGSCRHPVARGRPPRPFTRIQRPPPARHSAARLPPATPGNGHTTQPTPSVEHHGCIQAPETPMTFHPTPRASVGGTPKRYPGPEDIHGVPARRSHMWGRPDIHLSPRVGRWSGRRGSQTETAGPLAGPAEFAGGVTRAAGRCPQPAPPTARTRTGRRTPGPSAPRRSAAGRASRRRSSAR